MNMFQSTALSTINNKKDCILKQVINNLKGKEESGEKPVHVGEYVIIKIFPKVKSILKPRYEGPYNGTKVKSNGRMIVVVNNKGKQVERNIKDIKIFTGKSREKHIKYSIVSEKQKRQQDQLLEEQQSHHNQQRYPERIRQPISRFGFKERE